MSIGVMEESVLGLEKLAMIGGNSKLSEPKWSIHEQRHIWSDGDQEFLLKAQKMLRDFGPILVNEGLLSP